MTCLAQTRPKPGMEDSDALAEFAGRVCYDSFGKGRKTNQEYLANILDKQHYSVVEHGSVTFFLEGISRACSHEIVRHRHLSFSQRSQRYCTEIDFVLHPGLSAEQSAYMQAEALRTKHVYESLLKDNPGAKAAKEAARMILPNMVETKMVVTGNLRAWREFVIKRGSLAADAEIRGLACVILHKLKEIAPNTFQDLEVADGAVRTIPTQ